MIQKIKEDYGNRRSKGFLSKSPRVKWKQKSKYIV